MVLLGLWVTWQSHDCLLVSILQSNHYCVRYQLTAFCPPTSHITRSYLERGTVSTLKPVENITYTHTHPHHTHTPHMCMITAYPVHTRKYTCWEHVYSFIVPQCAASLYHIMFDLMIIHRMPTCSCASLKTIPMYIKALVCVSCAINTCKWPMVS